MTTLLAREAGVPVIDLDPAFRATGDPLALFPFRLPGHDTAEGHALVAQTVLRRLRDAEALP